MANLLTKGQKITLDVVADSYGYYTLNLDGKNVKVKKFDFQRYDKTPEQVACIVDRVDGNLVFLKQDMSPIFAARYRQGESYEFIVEADMTKTEMPHYKVTQEGLGYWILLPAKRGMKLTHGDRVRCRVGKMQGINLNLQIEEVLERHGEPPMVLVTRNDLDTNIGAEQVEQLFAALAEEPRMVKAMSMLKARNPEWILEALRTAREHFLTSGIRPDPERVATLRAITAYVLEDTELLCAFAAPRRFALREETARLVSYCDDMLTALGIVDEGRQNEYISHIMEKLRASGYLYRPESKLRTLMCVFSLDPDSIDSRMTELIEVIHRGNPSSWMAEPFRSAFIEQLQLYIDSCHTILDNISEIDGDEAESRLDKMLAAIAIQQILASGRRGAASSEAADELAVNRSRLYRYFSFKSNCEKQQMLEKALQVAISGDIPDNEFKWDDTKDLGRLARTLVKTEPLDGSTYTFATPQATLSVDSSSIALRINGSDASHSVIPAKLPLWHGLQIWLSDALPPENRRPGTILQFRDTFALVRQALAGTRKSKGSAESAVVETVVKPKEAKKKRKLMLPDPGDTVEIIVESIVNDTPGNERFACRVVEDGYRGEGFLDRSNLIRGNGAVPLSVFFDPDGRPYRLTARVMACSPADDTLSFSVIDELNRYVNDNVELNSELNAVVTAMPSHTGGFFGDRFTVFTEHGFTAWVDGGDFSEAIMPGDNIRIRIDSVGTGARQETLATCIQSYVPEKVTFEDSLATLIYSYADERVYGADTTTPQDYHAEAARGDSKTDAADSAGQMDEPLSDIRVGELMRIIARMADLTTEMVHAYNYFWFARLMAEMLGLEQQALYYARRCSVIEVLDEFASNGRVDLVRVDSLSEMIMEASSSSSETQKLKLLAALDRPDRTDKVWDVIRSTMSTQIDKLGRLILAYNALDGFKLGRERSAIREQIYNELHLSPDTLPEQLENGLESQTVEFKTSLVYPAGNAMRRDVRRQTREILQIIAGFLNSQGGRLYIGVSDEGYVRGVANDLEFFKAPDKMDLYLMNEINNNFKMVNRHIFIRSSWQEYDGKKVYVVDVKPTRTPIVYEGVYYQRHSTSTRPIPRELEAEFIRNRKDPSVPLSFVAGEPEQALAPVTAMVPVATATAAPAEETHAEPVATPAESVEEAIIASEPRRREIPQIATSVLRDNRDFDTCDGTPFHEPVSFLYITGDDGSYRISRQNMWIDDSARLSLKLREDEAAGYLLAIFDSGHGIRYQYDRLDPQGRISGGDLVFLSPVRPDDGVFIYYSTDDGRNVIKRYFGPDSLPLGSTYEQGERLIPADATFLRAIIIGADRAASFARFERNGQRLSGGMADLDNDFERSLTYHLK